jgi:hypothetical protein
LVDDFNPRDNSQDQLIRSEKAKTTADRTSTPTWKTAHSDGIKDTQLRNAEYSPRIRLFGHLWSQEILACILGAAAISALVATLYMHEGRPLPKWPFKISVNTLVLVFSMVLKTSITFVIDSCIGQLRWLWFRNSRSLYDAVRYDEASRGPWGSAKLLVSHFLYRPVTSFVAIMSLLSMAVDPFFQQILRYGDCQVPMPKRQLENTSAKFLRQISRLPSLICDRPQSSSTNISKCGCYGATRSCTVRLSHGKLHIPRIFDSWLLQQLRGYLADTILL